MFNHSVASLGSKSPTSFRVGKQGHLPPEPGFLGLQQEVASQLFPKRSCRDAGRHDSRTAGHGLEQDQSHSVVAGGNHDNVRRSGRAGSSRKPTSSTRSLRPKSLTCFSIAGLVLTVPYQPKTDRWCAHHGERCYGHVWRTRTGTAARRRLPKGRPIGRQLDPRDRTGKNQPRWDSAWSPSNPPAGDDCPCDRSSRRPTAAVVNGSRSRSTRAWMRAVNPPPAMTSHAGEHNRESTAARGWPPLAVQSRRPSRNAGGPDLESGPAVGVRITATVKVG